MREIKFRAWNETDKLMCEPFGVRHGGLMWKSKLETAVTYKSLMPDDLLLQFAGFKDKNGVDIYEGDIIKWKFVNTGEEEPEYTEPVEWNECGFFLDGGAPLTVAMDDCEVIGNIFQHPELLSPHKP